MAALLLVQLNTVPGAVPTKLTAVVSSLHTTWSAGSATVGVGFTVMVKAAAAPVQVTPLAVNVGVTVKALTNRASVAFATVKAGTLPVPLVAASSSPPGVRDQSNTVPAGLPMRWSLPSCRGSGLCRSLRSRWVSGSRPAQRT